MLDIIMPHYNEPFDVGRPFFDMLALQRCVDFRQIRVILVHDGTTKFGKPMIVKYPFQIDQYVIEHKGVSAARNYGLEKATAEWVAFCDFDDAFVNAYALKLIFDSLNPDFDLLWNPIFMEDFNHGKIKIYPYDKFNMVFVHNKYFRREFLLSTGLRFNENLQYAEDSAFLAVLNIHLKDGKVGEIKTPEPLYVWSYRPGSCTTDTKNTLRNVRHLFEANKYIAEEMVRLNYEQAPLMMFRAVTDAYVSASKSNIRHDKDFMMKVSEYWKEHRCEIGKMDRKKLSNVLSSSLKNKKLLASDEKIPSFAEWIGEINNV